MTKDNSRIEIINKKVIKYDTKYSENTKDLSEYGVKDNEETYSFQNKGKLKESRVNKRLKLKYSKQNILNNPNLDTDNGIEDEEEIIEEFEERDKRPVHKLKVSKSSFDLREVRGFVFGGISSRFWMLRKHICSMQLDYFLNMPFYNW